MASREKTWRACEKALTKERFLMSKDKIMNFSMDGDAFKILINHEGQHSIWPISQPIPAGWDQIGPEGPKQDCLEWIKMNWPDIAPLSLRTPRQ
jgi:MbtH protein